MKSNLEVRVKGKTFHVPVEHNGADPGSTKMGPLPPEVAEVYEIRFFSVPFLVRKDTGRAEYETA